MSTMNSSFWDRFSLSHEEAKQCLKAVQDHYPRHQIAQFKEQGQCSLTLLARPQRPSLAPDDDPAPQPHIIQLRPAHHALTMAIAHAAKATYPSLAPATRALQLPLPRDLRAYEMEKMQGTPLAQLLPRSRSLDDATRSALEHLLDDFASFITHPLHTCPSPPPRSARADSPMDALPNAPKCTGKVGSSIVPRLEMLARSLPDASLRSRAADTLSRFQALESWPVVLTHGDLLPTNVLVDRATWAVTGVVDWAEAEELPFGIAVFAVEGMLGYFDCEGDRFVYFDGAVELRERFWGRVVTGLEGTGVRRGEVEVVRDVGVLLWKGIAWDGGRIERVVNEVDDGEDVACLRAFLGIR